MAMQEILVELVYQLDSEGRYSVTSTDIPGFCMSGKDIDVILADLNEVVSDLLRLNSNFEVQNLRWVPSLADIKRHLEKPGPESPARYVVSGKLAA